MKVTSVWHPLVLLALAIVVSGCGSPSEPADEAESTPASGQEVVDAAGPDSAAIDAELVEWADEVAAAVGALQAARLDAAEQFEWSWRPGPVELDAQLALFDADSEALTAFLAALPSPPRDPPLADSYEVFMDRTGDLVADVDRIVTTLDDRAPELRVVLEGADDPAGLGHPAIDEIIGDHPLVLDQWRRACFDLQAFVADLIDEPIDCVGIGATTPADIDVVDPSLIDFSINCQRGEGLAALSFDHTTYPWLAALPADTSWINSVVVITNNADTPVQVQTDFRVRFDDSAGDKILESDWLEPFAPAFHLQPGQTINRTSFAVDGLTFARPLRGEELNPEAVAEVFERLDQCVAVGQPRTVATPASPAIDPAWADRVDLIDCSSNPATGNYETTIEVTNPTTEPVRVDVAFEIVDASGTRLGMGANDGPIFVPAGETASGLGWSVLYTIVAPDTADHCRVVSIDASS